MPNHCSNSLFLEFEDTDTGRELYQDVLKAIEKEELLNLIVPMPEELKESTSGFFGDAEKQKAHEERAQYLIETYGYPSWYEFAYSNWGTKWDIYDSYVVEKKDGSYIRVRFNTAWSPPIAAYEEFLNREGLKTIQGYYFEGGMGFCGLYDDGFDGSYEIKEYSTGSIKKYIPMPILEEMGILDWIAECEEELLDEA